MAYQKFPTNEELKAAKKSKKSGEDLLKGAKYYEYNRASNRTPIADPKSGKYKYVQDYNVDHLAGTIGKKPPTPTTKKKGK